MTLCSCRHDSSTPGDITEHWQRTGALRGRAVELTFTLNRLLMNPWSEEEEAAAIGRKQNNKKKKNNNCTFFTTCPSLPDCRGAAERAQLLLAGARGGGGSGQWALSGPGTGRGRRGGEEEAKDTVCVCVAEAAERGQQPREPCTCEHREFPALCFPPGRADLLWEKLQ